MQRKCGHYPPYPLGSREAKSPSAKSAVSGPELSSAFKSPGTRLGNPGVRSARAAMIRAPRASRPLPDADLLADGNLARVLPWSGRARTRDRFTTAFLTLLLLAAACTGSDEPVAKDSSPRATSSGSSLGQPVQL